MNSTSLTALLSLSTDCRLAIVLAAASYSAADRLTLRGFLLLCKDFYKLVLANWPLIVEHYTLKEKLPDRIRYTFCGKPHRDNDLPAVIDFDGTQKWYRYGKLHRDNDLPAVICAGGTRGWWQHGKFIRKQ